jgi:hypothetical protein
MTRTLVDQTGKRPTIFNQVPEGNVGEPRTDPTGIACLYRTREDRRPRGRTRSMTGVVPDDLTCG